jgi:AraC-like DNA-binding protein
MGLKTFRPGKISKRRSSRIRAVLGEKMLQLPENNYIRYSPRNGFQPAEEFGITRSEPEFFEHNWSWSWDIGSGKFAKIQIRPGFDVWIEECRLREKIVFSMENHPSALCFSFCLSGGSTASYGARRTTLEMSGGKQGVFYLPDPNGNGHLKTETLMHQVGIIFEPREFLSYFEDDISLIPSVLRNAFDCRRDDIFVCMQDISPAMYIALHQIVNCPYRGMARKLYIESRALELVAAQLDQISSLGRPSVSGGGMCSRDRDRTDLARSLLLNDMENPPGLKELARAAGMSHPKLNCCFLKKYGMTVFQYLRNERLNRARTMLEEQGFSVTETAYSVGYSSLSHFAKAYKKQFGISPGIYSRRS